MKINFDGSFKEVRKLLDAPVKRLEIEKSKGDFPALISSISPNARHIAEHTEENLRPEKLPEPESLADRGPMASFRLDGPRTELPRLNPLNIEETPVNPPTNGVKTPSVISVKRIKAEQGEAHVEQMLRIIGDAGQRHGIDPALSAAVAKAESSFNPKAVSSDGHQSKGLMQLLDSTGQDMLSKLGLKKDYDPFNADQNVDLGVGYLRYLHQIFSSATELPKFGTTVPAADSSSLEKLAVAAFNAGEGRVTSAQLRAVKAGKDSSQYEQIEKYLPETTQEYVRRVIEFRDQLKPEFEG